MTPPISYIAAGEKTSPKFCRAFAIGCGGLAMTTLHLQPGSVALFGSPQLWPLLREAQQQRRTWFYGDHGVFTRGTHVRIARNAYSPDGSQPATPDRFHACRRPVAPWQQGGRHVLLCMQSPGYFRLFGLDVWAWIAEISDQVAQHTDRPLRVRWKHDPSPLAADLVNCWAVVTYTSNSAVEALLAGVPVFVLGEHAAAYRMGQPDLAQIETPRYPEREPFFWALADRQWTLREITAGVAWRVLKNQEDCS